MKNFYENDETLPETSRGVIVKRLIKHFPDRNFDSDDELFEVLASYDADLDERFEKLRKDQTKLAQIFTSNPKMAGFISTVIEGEDPLIACVRYFGGDVLQCAYDEDRLMQLRKENDAYLDRMQTYAKTEKEIEENWKVSAKSIERFKEAKGMTDEEFDMFIEKVCHLCEHVFMCDFSYEVLDTLFKGVNYDTDIDLAEQTGEVKGRNQRIIFSKDKSDAATSQSLKTDSSADLTPMFGLRRRKSVWDM
ncbi:MAG: hypothetical protein IKL50_07395 [Bacteroidales bacterium]|nr:hypothetical protein [Bacteroidales bacterium]MBR2476117.1 hypothetical protein [Bacteroidaceae bacterium]MBR3609688.1 hypothetical protein [Bacteroidales bacterium]